MPDETDLVRAGVEGAAKGTIDSILEPFKALVMRFCQEVGEGFGYYGRLFRLRMGLQVMRKAKKMLEEAGIDHSAVPPKLFVPIIENASLEDGETLQNKWAALLANAADPRSKAKVHPAFVGILRDLTPAEADLLNNIYAYVCEQIKMENLYRNSASAPQIDLAEPMQANGALHFLDALELQPIIDHLQGLRLIEFEASAIITNIDHMTAFGFEFVAACRPPGSSPFDTENP